MFENRVLRRVFGSMRDEVKLEGRKLYNEVCAACGFLDGMPQSLPSC
jgi:cytochrome c